MPGITVERTAELQHKICEILIDQQEGLPAREVLSRLEKVLPLTEFEAGRYKDGMRRFEKLVRFGTIWLVKAGWLVKDKGSWSLTEDGRKAFADHANPGDFLRQAQRLYAAWKKNQPGDDTALDDSDDGAAAAAATRFEEAQEAAWAQVREYLHSMPPYEFQRLVAALLRAMGYHVPWDAPRGPDRGIDIIAYPDPLGAANPRIKVQVKRRGDKVDAEALRAFVSLLHENDVGIFVCLAGFTSNAETEARMQEKRRITLMDIDRVFSLWVEHYDRVAEVDRHLLPLRPVYYLAPAE